MCIVFCHEAALQLSLASIAYHLAPVGTIQLLFLLCVQVVPLATHPYGCRVIQRALEHANVAQCRRLLEEVLRNTNHLVQVSISTEVGGKWTFTDHVSKIGLAHHTLKHHSRLDLCLYIQAKSKEDQKYNYLLVKEALQTAVIDIVCSEWVITTSEHSAMRQLLNGAATGARTDEHNK